MAETAKKLTLKQIEGLLSEMTIETALEKLYGFKEEYGAKIDKLVLKYEKRKQSYNFV